MDLYKTLLIILVAFFAYMHSYMGSTMHNRPIIVAPLVGLVLGNAQLGIMVGATLELVFMGAFPIGASNPPDMVSGTVIAAAYVILTGQDIAAAVTIAIPIASLVLMFDNFLMSVVLTWAAHIADKFALDGNIEGVEMVTRIAGIGNKVILALVVGLGFYLGVPVIEKIIAFVPEWVTHGLDVAAGIIPAIGFAMLARMMLSGKNVAFLILGFILAAYLNMPIIGIALMGVVVVLIYYHFAYKKVNQEVVVDDNEF